MPTGVITGTGSELAEDAPRESPRLTRERYAELLPVAKECCDWIEGKGVKQHEGCQFRRLVEDLWNLPK